MVYFEKRKRFIVLRPDRKRNIGGGSPPPTPQTTSGISEITY